MCGRYTLIKTTELSERFGIKGEVPQLAPNYNTAPSQTMPIVTGEPGERQLQLMKWGLVPAWSKIPKTAFSTINARAEGLEDSRLYRRPLLKQRCIVPADGFYEWQRQGEHKIPYYIRLQSQNTIGFAGLYEIWHAGSDDELRTFTIITTNANALMEPIHQRMPAILSSEHEEAWLNEELQDPFVLHSFLKPYPAEAMEAFVVSNVVNKPSNNSPELILNSQ
jgi:putative SOS response-associated peptidase YedK